MNLVSFGKTVMFVAAILFLSGFIIFFMGRIGISRLPGDIFFKKGNTSFSFPVVTSIIVSIILTIIINVVIYFTRR